MKYLIDAYNVIGKLDSIQLFESSKEYLFSQWMSRHIASKKDHYILIFDGHHLGYEYGSTSTFKQITVRYTDITESADAYILRKAPTYQPSEITIVSSDLLIVRPLKRLGHRCLSSTDFIERCLETNDADENNKPITDSNVEFWLSQFGS